jgi:hypothetical protein
VQPQGKRREKGKQCRSKVRNVRFVLNLSHRTDLLNRFISTAITIDSDADSDHSLPPSHLAFASQKPSSSLVAPSTRLSPPGLAWGSLFVPDSPSDAGTGGQTTSLSTVSVAGPSSEPINFSTAGTSNAIPGPFDLQPVISAPHVARTRKVFSIFNDTTPYIQLSDDLTELAHDPWA